MRDRINESAHWTHTTGFGSVPLVSSLDLVRVLAAAREGRGGWGWGKAAARQLAGWWWRIGRAVRRLGRRGGERSYVEHPAWRGDEKRPPRG